MRAKVELNYCGESIKQNVCSFQIEPLFISNISSALRETKSQCAQIYNNKISKKSLKHPTLLLSFQLVIASLNTIHIHTQSQIYYHQIKIKKQAYCQSFKLKNRNYH